MVPTNVPFIVLCLLCVHTGSTGLGAAGAEPSSCIASLKCHVGKHKAALIALNNNSTRSALINTLARLPPPPPACVATYADVRNRQIALGLHKGDTAYYSRCRTHRAYMADDGFVSAFLAVLTGLLIAYTCNSKDAKL